MSRKVGERVWWRDDPVMEGVIVEVTEKSITIDVDGVHIVDTPDQFVPCKEGKKISYRPTGF